MSLRLSDMDLDQILFENNFFLAMLGGDLQLSNKTGPELVEALARKPEEFNSIWKKPTSELRSERGRSSTWIDAINWGSSKNRVRDLREQFMQMLNRPQGDSRKEAKYIDAPYLLELIDQFSKRKWTIDTGLVIDIDGDDLIYKEWLQAYVYFQAHLERFSRPRKTMFRRRFQRYSHGWANTLRLRYSMRLR